MWVRGLKSEIERRIYHVASKVAPHVGAWIEIAVKADTLICVRRSHPMWVRGLKYCGGELNGIV